MTVGIHTVVSQFNVREVPALRKHVREEFAPDSYITELAEERLELDTIGLDITPTAEAYGTVVQDLLSDMETTPGVGFSSIVQSFRREYYQIAQQTLKEQRQVSAVLCRSRLCADCPQRGRLDVLHARRVDGQPARDQFRFHEGVDQPSRRTSCAGASVAESAHCPLANAAYSSMLCDPPSIVRVGMRWLGSRLKPASTPRPAPVGEVAP